MKSACYCLNLTKIVYFDLHTKKEYICNFLLTHVQLISVADNVVAFVGTLGR
jgi:hypothetical protein